MQETHL